MTSSAKISIRLTGLCCILITAFWGRIGHADTPRPNASAPPVQTLPALAQPLPLPEIPGQTDSLSLLLPGAGPTQQSDAANSTNSSLKQFQTQLTNACYLAQTRQFNLAEPALVKLLAEAVPDKIQRQALFELGSVVQEEKDLPRAQSIYAQFLNRWSDDFRVPEILLRQGQIFRQMGLNDLALAKFYSVMTAALSLKQNQLGYYQQLVLQAQIEIAETNFQAGKYADAAEYYSRLLKNTDSGLDHSEVQFLLIRALVAAKRYDRAVGEARDFLKDFPDARREPEARYFLAEALKAQGHNGDALQQVLLFLKQEKAKAEEDPKAWSYWQQRVGNEIGNQLYQEGDYVRALQVYKSLARLDASAAWQLPVEYQIGLTYERLLQPQKARSIYEKIIAHQAALGTNTTPALETVLDMSRWRVGFINWQYQAAAENRALASDVITNAAGLP